MEKKVLLKKLVDAGTHIRSEFTPTAIVSDYGTRPIGEFWDANKTVDVIVNGAHIMHDTVRETDEYIHHVNDIKTGRIGQNDNDPITNIKALTNAQINSLKAGDTVIKTTGDQTHSYVVAYKKDDEMSLVYTDCWTVEEVYYEKQGNNWTYIQTDVFKPEDYYTKNQVDSNFIKVITTDNIVAMTNEQLNSLRAGDVVVKITGNMKHTYTVSYKEDNKGICITYTDAGYLETVSYDYIDDNWVYNSTDVITFDNLISRIEALEQAVFEQQEPSNTEQ